MNDSQAEFIVESREHLAVFEQSLLSLERAADGDESRTLIQRGLRAVHSLKGDSGFLGFVRIRELAHSMESLLEDYRDGARLPSTAIVEALLAARDRLAAMVEDLDHSHAASIDDVVQRLQSLEGSASHTIPLDINLQRWMSVHSGTSIVELFKQLDGLGRIENHQLTGMPDLTALTTSGVATNCEVCFSGTLITKCSPEDVATLVRNRESATDNSERRIDLLEWQHCGGGLLVSLFRDIAEAGEVSGPRLAFSPDELTAGLPGSSIIWSGRQKLNATIAESVPTTERAVEGLAPASRESESVVQPLAEHQETDVPRSPARLSEKSVAAKPAANAENDRLRSLRINVELLDRLMNLVGELTLIRNQTQVTFAEQEGESRNLIQRLNSVTSELQDTVLQTRMQPVGNLFGRFPRMVRDLARQLGKEVDVVTVGQDVELDKTVLERLSDPLTHLIRNSIDHGLESPDVRAAAGKPRTGKIVLSATPADGQVYIEIRDDGRGIDPAAVKAKAASTGLRTEAELDRMSSRELLSLILLPGFSTAKKVTDVSGRGVGMDVVKTNVEELEGHLSIDSWPGQGTSMVLRVPLTLAIVPCLIVTVGEDRFAVPQRELEEIVCLHSGGKRHLEHAFDAEVFRLRESLLPVVRLSEVLARPNAFTAADKAEILAKHPPSERDLSQIEYILVLRSNGKRFGLLVDNVQGREEIVVKPMHMAMRQLSVFSGATLMGDGRVALITNVEGILEHARCYATITEEGSKPAIRDPHEVHRVLLFEYGPNEQFALPLVQVRRVELLEMSRIEQVGDREFVTIDGQSTRIVRLDGVMNVSTCDAASTMFLILPKFVSEPMGILAHRIIDTESLAIELQSDASQPGVLGSAIVRTKLTLFLDVQQIREFVFGNSVIAGSESTSVQVSPSGSTDTAGDGRTFFPQFEGSTDRPVQRILLVDDTSFFREIVKRYLSSDKVAIMTGIDGLDGLELLAKYAFDLVVSDIEMPNMDGWQFCKAARDKGYRMPFVALTSLAKAEHEQKAIACGFDDYEEKLEHDRLKRKVQLWLDRSFERTVQR
jgi:two-component system chemotaxis sensor kinase CheA